MPRKYKLKFGGGEGSQPMNTTPLIIGVILLVIILPIFGLIGYYGFYLDKCKLSIKELFICFLFCYIFLNTLHPRNSIMSK